MAKGRVGVLEFYETPKSASPKTHCGRAIAERLVETYEAKRIGRRMIQMVRSKASDAIRQAKAARDVALRLEEALLNRLKSFDGPLGVGNLLPFAKPDSSGDKLHYEIPMAGDRTPYARHFGRNIRPSKRVADEIAIAQMSAAFNWRVKMRHAIA